MFNHRSGLSANVLAISVSQPLGNNRYISYDDDAGAVATQISHWPLLMLRYVFKKDFPPEQPAETNGHPKS